MRINFHANRPGAARPVFPGLPGTGAAGRLGLAFFFLIFKMFSWIVRGGAMPGVEAPWLV